MDPYCEDSMILDLCIKDKPSSPVTSETSSTENPPQQAPAARVNEEEKPRRGKRVQRIRSSEDKQLAIELYSTGVTKAEVSRLMNVPESTLRGWLKEANRFGDDVSPPRNSGASEEPNSPPTGCTSDEETKFHNVDGIDEPPPPKRRKSTGGRLEQVKHYEGHYAGGEINQAEMEHIQMIQYREYLKALHYRNAASSGCTYETYIGQNYQSTSCQSPPAAHEASNPQRLVIPLADYANVQPKNMKIGRRKRKSSCLKSDAENVDPLTPKPRGKRNQRQPAVPAVGQTDEEKNAYLKRRQQEISKKVMESVIKEKIVDSQKREVPTMDEAIEYGEKFQMWLENCSDPSVSKSRILEFRKLMNNIIASKQRKSIG